MMSNEDRIFDIQKKLLVCIKEFDKLCRENNINYTIHGGTLLGAVRGKGFIPWDDDIDIAITREEYKRLEMLLRNDRGRSALVLDSKMDKIKKIWLRNDDQDKIWIDVFIYDFISERKVFQKVKLIGLKVLSAFSKSKHTIQVFRKNERAKGLTRIVFEIIYSIGSLFPLEARLKLFDMFSEKAFTGKKEHIHRANDQLIGIGIIHSKSVMQSFVDMYFEDAILLASAEYDQMLRKCYGDDYMLPRRDISQELVHELTRGNSI